MEHATSGVLAWPTDNVLAWPRRHKEYPKGGQKTMPSDNTLDTDELNAMNAWWRASNYISAGQIFLMANPLLSEPLRPEHIQHRHL